MVSGCGRRETLLMTATEDILSTSRDASRWQSARNELLGGSERIFERPSEGKRKERE
jgi:hypothetical protein